MQCAWRTLRDLAINTMTSRPEDQGFEIVINGVNRFFADLELSAIASAGFHKGNYPEDTVQIRRCADGTLRTVLGYAQLSNANEHSDEAQS
jgi:hypothetical protein